MKMTKFNYLLILFITILYPINIKIISFLRPVDIIILFSFCYALVTNQLKKKFVNGYIYFLASTLFLSTIVGSLVNGWELKGFAIIYKYIMLFVFIWTLLSVKISLVYINKLKKVLFATFVVMVFYIYGRLVFSTIGITTLKGGLRPDFPFTVNPPNIPNAGHLVGAYISTGFVALILHFISKNRSKLIVTILIILTFFAIPLTGSRMPIVAIAMWVAFIATVQFLQVKFCIRKKTVTYLLSLVIISLIIAGFFVFSFNLHEEIILILERTMKLDFLGDASASARVQKAIHAIEHLQRTGYILGSGPLSYYNWFDNGFIRLFHDGGPFFLLVIMFIFIRFMFSLDIKDDNPKIIFYTLIMFVFNCISAEFYLISRVSTPLILFVGLLLKEKECERDETIDNYSSI